MDRGEQLEIEARLKQQIEAYHEAAMLFAAITCGLPDVMKANGPATPEALATELGMRPDPLRRFLRGLATMRLCEALEDGRFALTPAGARLALGSDSSLREKALVVGRQYWLPWLALPHSLQTGEPSFPALHGSTVSDWRMANADDGAYFHRYLAKEEMANAGDLLPFLKYAPGDGVVASIGGGYGGWLVPLVRDNPGAKGVVFEAPMIVEDAKRLFADTGTIDRIKFVGGDILKEIPVEADLYVLKGVLQQHGDENARTILQNCREALKAGAKLVIVERLMPDTATDDPAAVMLDLHMMTITGGKTRTRPEMEALIAAAGLTVTDAAKTPSGLAVIECTP
jgi:SAM-dependent methyltransferase